jgi:cytidylate kinase
MEVMLDSEVSCNKITITGDLGSGKSAVSKLLQSALGFEIYSTGKVQREIAARLGMTTLELNQYAETHPEIDEEIDNAFKQLNSRPEGLIVDSRLAWFFMPASFKVFLTVPVEVAAQRIMSDPTRKSEQYDNPIQAIEELLARKRSENERFLKIYGADCTNLANFNLTVDTSGIAPSEVSERISNSFRQWQATQQGSSCLPASK